MPHFFHVSSLIFLQGLAYVDFSDQENLSSAISKNKQTMLGYRLNVARSDPKRGQKKASTHGGT